MPSQPEPQDALLRRLAERPFDKSLRLVFADWLLEHGDPRGEAIALFERRAADLSLSERRRLARITEQHLGDWFKSLSEIMDLSLSRCEGGFLSHLVCVAPQRSEAWGRLAGDLNLATVRSLVLPASREAAEVAIFLRHPVLAQVKRLQASSGAWALFEPEQPQPAFSLESVAVASWGTFRGELESVRRFPGLKTAERLELVTSEFVNPLVVADVWESLLSQVGVLAEVPRLKLLARFGVVEGAASWLVLGATVGLERHWPAGKSWAIEYGDAVFTLERGEGGFNQLKVDLSAGADQLGLGQRIATAASVIVSLGPAKLTSVDIELPAGARVRASERDSLRAASRRLGTVKHFQLAGAQVAP